MERNYYKLVVLMTRCKTCIMICAVIIGGCLWHKHLPHTKGEVVLTIAIHIQISPFQCSGTSQIASKGFAIKRIWLMDSRSTVIQTARNHFSNYHWDAFIVLNSLSHAPREKMNRYFHDLWYIVFFFILFSQILWYIEISI